MKGKIFLEKIQPIKTDSREVGRLNRLLAFKYINSKVKILPTKTLSGLDSFTRNFSQTANKEIILFYRINFSY